MAQYAVLIYSSDSAHAPDATAATSEEVAACDEHSNALNSGSVMTAAWAFTPRGMAKAIRATAITDGPMVDAEHVVAGIYFLEASDLDAALAVARTNPVVTQGGGVEVRPVHSGGPAVGSQSTISERGRLQYFLDQQRNAVLTIIEGLDETQLHTPVLPSGWTPIGLIRHLADAEAFWFQGVVLGSRPQMTWDDGTQDPPREHTAPFATARASAAVIAQYRRQCEFSNEILRSRDLHATLLGQLGFDWPDEPISDLRWVVLHMIEETARHAGHLDAARELLDGAIGRGPR